MCDSSVGSALSPLDTPVPLHGIKPASPREIRDEISAAATVAFDQAHIWHPYAPSPAAVDPLVVTAATGCWLTFADGSTAIDAMSSWWCAAHGHRHPALVEAAHQQLDSLSHVMFGGLTHHPAVDLAERLLAVAPAGLEKVFFADSGSVAVEVAHKMALQYQRGVGAAKRKRLLTWRGGYHGDTVAPMSVCDPEGGMHTLWRGVLPEQEFLPIPPPQGSSDATIATYVAAASAAMTDDIAAFIFEPLVQGAGGMRFHDARLVTAMVQACHARGIVVIADEIATGFGRTGSMFACDAAQVTPDILCVGKALTGGMMTLSAVLATSKIAAAIDTPAGGGALMHGPTFMANPLACRVAAASVDLFATGYWRPRIGAIEQQLREGLADLAALAGVADVRVCGAIGVVEMRQPVDQQITQQAALSEQVWVRPFGKLIYTMPPFVVTSDELAQIIRGVRAAVIAADNHEKKALLAGANAPNQGSRSRL
ncbi:adenosylmethionine--8-amino-7-oxononanoate transaminase [Corynebacterium choanae]|nr:adenosylmethionine--8-amino-7-oxononanoate transaminase [Corynebacterium choanae]